MSHHPTYATTGRHGCWATCSCGWKSELWRELMGAQLDFAKHLTTTPAVDTTREAKATNHTEETS